MPAVGSLFSSFLGYNPLKSLLGSRAAAHVSKTQWSTLTGKHFFPSLIQSPFHHGLIIVFAVAIAHLARRRGLFRPAWRALRPPATARRSTRGRTRRELWRRARRDRPRPRGRAMTTLAPVITGPPRRGFVWCWSPRRGPCAARAARPVTPADLRDRHLEDTGAAAHLSPWPPPRARPLGGDAHRREPREAQGLSGAPTTPRTVVPVSSN